MIVPAMWEHLKRGQPLNPKFVAILNNLGKTPNTTKTYIVLIKIGIRHSTQTGEESDGFKKPSLHYGMSLYIENTKINTNTIS